MADIDAALTSEALRSAIRAKLETGVSRRAVSILVAACAVDTGNSRVVRREDGVERRAVEDIPLERRADFLKALKSL